MLKSFMKDQSGATMLEYLVGGALALGILGTCIWALMNTVKGKGDLAESQVSSSTFPTFSAP
ncbi:MAG: Flp family type IVb pilin [Chloroflexi bacterium]|nr:Flp family type IVb pilin [Chloroflexota bacterium]